MSSFYMKHVKKLQTEISQYLNRVIKGNNRNIEQENGMCFKLKKSNRKSPKQLPSQLYPKLGNQSLAF